MPQAINNMSVTWTSGAAENGIKLNVTDTSSAAASNLMDLQVGGVSRVLVAKTGRIDMQGDLRNYASGGGIRQLSNTGYFSLGAADDVVLTRDGAADTLAQRRATNPQTFRIYNTFTDTSNYERGFMRWSSNELQIGAEAAGSGTARNLKFTAGGVDTFTVTSGSLTLNSGVALNTSGRGGLSFSANGFMQIYSSGFTNSAGFKVPSNGTVQARTSNDSGFANVQGKLTADTNAVAETPTATHTITIYDAAGTGYKVLCVAA